MILTNEREVIKMTVFTFKCWYEGDDERQERYVLAKSEEEAIKKMELYTESLFNRGFGNLIFADPIVELENVII